MFREAEASFGGVDIVFINAGENLNRGSVEAGLWMLTRVLAEELWPYNISVNELIPGPTAQSFSLMRRKM